MSKLHPRNPHQGRYDMAQLCQTLPELQQYLHASPRGEQTIDFADPAAVMCLNRALLAHHYQISHWFVPEGYLCPPIPGRADYIHYLADLLAEDNQGEIPRGRQVRVLDIGTGTNLIYPLLGNRSYGWKFTATDTDPVAVKCAKGIVAANPPLKGQISVVQQKDSGAIFKGVIPRGSRFDITLCNPPFHASAEAAQAGSQRKVRNLALSRGEALPSRGKARRQPAAAKLNFGGQDHELWCPGGELAFIRRMAAESVDFAGQVGWFTSLVADSDHIRPLKQYLSKLGAVDVRVIAMRQGQKMSRLLAWRFSHLSNKRLLKTTKRLVSTN